MNDVVRGLMGNDFFLASLCYLLVVVPTSDCYVHRPSEKRLSCLMRTNRHERKKSFPYTESKQSNHDHHNKVQGHSNNLMVTFSGCIHSSRKFVVITKMKDCFFLTGTDGTNLCRS